MPAKERDLLSPGRIENRSDEICTGKDTAAQKVEVIKSKQPENLRATDKLETNRQGNGIWKRDIDGAHVTIRKKSQGDQRSRRAL